MAKYDALAALPGGEPGPWGEPVTINYDQRDVLLYSVGIGIRDLRYIYEGNPEFRTADIVALQERRPDLARVLSPISERPNR